MKLQGKGSLFVHLFDPLLDFAKQSERLEGSIESTRAAAERGFSHRDVLGKSQILAVAGECDLLLRLDLTDLRAVTYLQSNLLDSGVQSAAWVLSVPYEPAETPADPEGSRPHGAAGVRPIHFVVHLRLRRAVYRVAGGEAAVLERIEDLLGKFPEIDATIHAGLGWFDLLISGRFTVPTETFAGFLVGLSKMHFGESVENVAVQKLLTLLGVEAGTGGTRLVSRPIVVARTSSAGYTRSPALLREHYRGMGAELLYVDGTRDVLVLPGEDAPPLPLEEILAAFSNQGERFLDAGIERLETHLLVMKPSDLEAQSSRGFSGRIAEPTVVPGSCSCSSVADELRELAKRVERLAVPEALRLTVLNVLTLQSYALNDETSCCDLRPALAASAAALGRIINGIEWLQRLHEGDPEHEPYWYEALHTRRDLLDHWCRSSEAVLSERTAGGFQEFFDVNDRIVAYRGGVQKLLLITDHLLNSFLSEIDSSPTELDAATALFATVHEPINAIRSEPALGFVKLPLRHRFSLPLVLPQLWHEVGQFVFRRRYPIPEHPETQRRLRELERQLRERARKLQRIRSSLLSAQSTGPGTGMTAASKRALRKLDRVDAELKGLAEHSRRSDEIFRILSDIYADLVVFVFGFRGDFTGFLLYLTTLYFDLARDESQQREAWERACDVLLIRLYCVSRVAVRWSEGREPETKGWRRCRVDSLVSLVQKVASLPLYEDLPPLPGKLRKRVYRIVTEKRVVEFIMQYIEDFCADHLPAPREDLGGWKIDPTTRDRIEAGEVVDLDVPWQINPYYGHLYTRQLQERLGQTEKRREASLWFREMAALGKSALLAFYRQSG